MNSLWNQNEAGQCGDDALSLRVYSSRLLGRDPQLVLHGGGNTSVKTRRRNLFGEEEDILFVKGSGCDLATIAAKDFSPCRLQLLQRMADLEAMSDRQMADEWRAAMTVPNAPAPSVEAILHAIIPFTFVDHTHADAIVAISNTLDGHRELADLYGDRVVLVPYSMPGFVLARRVRLLLGSHDCSRLDGIILEQHGVFTFAADARQSYERMISLVTQAEDLLRKKGALVQVPGDDHTLPATELRNLAALRRQVSQARGGAQIARFNGSDSVHAFAMRADAATLASRGPLTPDHVLRTKRLPLIIDSEEGSVAAYVDAYKTYFQRFARAEHTCLNPAPRWALWPKLGSVSFGCSVKEAEIVDDIIAHTLPAIEWAQKLGGWRPVGEADLFEVEYWDLEQAKLGKPGHALPHQGKIALVTGAGSGIGKATVEALCRAGAAVAALDLDPKVRDRFEDPAILPLVCNVTNREQVRDAVAETVRRFGGLDLLVSNAGVFTNSSPLADSDDEDWERSLAVNLSSHRTVLKHAVPYLERGIDAAVVVVGSRNLPAPGRGAAADSAATAGRTPQARIAALELAPQIRVNVIHPDSVYDTGIWTDDVLASRAQAYGMSVDEYKTRNLLRRSITSADVAALISTLLGPIFQHTTGAQIPIDGGNDRVI